MFNNSRNPFANLTPVVKNLLIINIICFIPFLMFDKPETGHTPVSDFFAAHYFNSSEFRPWQPITYMFMHGSFSHILFNMFALYSFGPILEYALGSKRFFNFYFLCGLGALLLQWIVQAIELQGITGHIINPDLRYATTTAAFNAYGEANFDKLMGIYHGGMVGASGAIFGVLVGFGMLYPNMELLILFIPVPVKAKYLIPVYIVIELFLGVKQIAGDSVAHFAHLGGALIGFIMIKIWGYGKRNNNY